jgi:hypothetical protein
VNEWYVVTAGHCVARARPSQVLSFVAVYILLRPSLCADYTLFILYRVFYSQLVDVDYITAFLCVDFFQTVRTYTVCWLLVESTVATVDLLQLCYLY